MIHAPGGYAPVRPCSSAHAQDPAAESRAIRLADLLDHTRAMGLESVAHLVRDARAANA